MLTTILLSSDLEDLSNKKTTIPVKTISEFLLTFCQHAIVRFPLGLFVSEKKSSSQLTTLLLPIICFFPNSFPLILLSNHYLKKGSIIT